MIEVSNIRFAYGNDLIFDDFSARFEGKITGLIGHNGAGKSTLVSLILALRKPESGRISVGGLDIRIDRREILKQIGVMFENPDFPDWYTIGDHLQFVGKLRGLSTEEARTEAVQLLDRFDLSEKWNSMFKTLSAGMKQKYAIAVAIIGYPRYVLLDEPTANLDVKARSDILEYIQELALSRDMHVVILSHILHDLERICDEVVFLHKGEVRGHYTIETLMRERFIRDYSIKVLDDGTKDDVLGILVELGIEKVVDKGVLLEFRLKEPNQLSALSRYSPVPRRSLLEQVFVDVVGGDES